MSCPPVSVEDALDELSRGRHVLVVNDVATLPLRRVDLVMAAATAQPLTMAALVRATTGFVNVALPRRRCSELVLPLLVADRDADTRPLPAVAVDAAEGVSTGISATDRATTARLLADPGAQASDLRRPGHVVPLRVPERALDVHSVVALEVELCARAGLAPAAVRAEVVGRHGELLTAGDAGRFAADHGLTVLSARRAFLELGFVDAEPEPVASGFGA